MPSLVVIPFVGCLFSQWLCCSCAASGLLVTIHRFGGSGPPGIPASLVQSSEGDFYGVTASGVTEDEKDVSDLGIIYKLTPDGGFAVLHRFTSEEGGEPFAGLVQGQDGNFYGAASSIVFMITPMGVMTVLHRLSGGGTVRSALIQARDGDFYGTTWGSEADPQGTVFRMTSKGMLTTLHSFMGTEGSYPSALIQGNDGNFYGMTREGGSESNGTVFKITPTGMLTTLHNFGVYEDGQIPKSGLVQGRDGKFYGTTELGGAPGGDGTVFVIDATGALKTLHRFRYDGQNPVAPLVRGRDGNLYGTTRAGGEHGRGTIFVVTPNGSLKTLYSFNDADGCIPEAALTLAQDGSFYGTTNYGGISPAGGTIFRFEPAAHLPTDAGESP